MSLFLITGLPGTGKTTVCMELKARGYTAYDGDEDGLAHWFDAAGNAVKMDDEDRTPEFVQTHTRDIARQTVERLAAQAIDKQVFLCADPENEGDLRDLFAKAFALVLEEPIRQHRLDNRKNNKWGKLPHERVYDLAHMGIAYDRYKKFKYITINSAQPVETIVDNLVFNLNT